MMNDNPFRRGDLNAAFLLSSLPESQPFPVEDGGDLVYKVSTQTG